MIKVSRNIGTCSACQAKNTQVVVAYDPSVYEGGVCAVCILAGKASTEHDVDSKVMRPMIFVARGIMGIEPYARLLKSAEQQSKDPKGSKEKLAQISKMKRLRDAKVLPQYIQPRNRAERRRAAKLKASQK